MSRYTGVVVTLVAAAAVMTGATVDAAPPVMSGPASTAELPRKIPGGVELTLADGDLFRVWTAPEGRGVLSRRRDAANGSWGAPAVVLDEKNVTCQEVDARTASGAVALLASCRIYPRGADQASPSVRALWSSDTVTWSSYTFDGEAFEEPGISPDGQSAVWSQIGNYLTHTDAGFVEHEFYVEGLSANVTATITDAEQVSYLYGDDADGSCALVVLTRTGEAPFARQEIPLAQACADETLRSVDADTVLLGAVTSPARRTVVSRPNPASSWAVTEVAPRTAPGLVTVARGLPTDFFTAPGFPLFALGSRDRHVVRAQAYDRTTQTWGPSSVAYDAGQRRCRWAGARYVEPLAVVLAELVCVDERIVLTPRGDGTWRALRGGTQPVAPSPDGRQVAVPGRSRTFVVSPERGVVTLPYGVAGPCDLVVPDGPDGAVLLTAAGRHRGWPTVLKHSTRSGWATLSRTNFTFPPSRCRRVQSDTYSLPYSFRLKGDHQDAFIAWVVQRDGTWKAVLKRWW